MKTALLTGILVSMTFILSVVVISLVVTLSPNTGGATDYPSLIIDDINKNSIDSFLRNLTKYPHPAGSNRSHEIAKIIAEKWKQHGLQNVNIMSYDVFLSQADPDNTNYFQILDSSGEELYISSPYQPPVDEFPQEDQDKILAFNAFSGNGVVNSTRVVYANYGTEDDFMNLDAHSTSVNKSIVLIRYGKIFRGDKVRMAAERHALGVILYTDPADAAPLEGPNAVYPDTIYAPDGGIQLGSLALQGDLLTPGFPATDYAFRIPKGEADMPKIPVQPIGYADAYQIISLLGGNDVKETDWQGGLNITYKYGGELKNGTTLLLSVSNINQRQNIYNVIGSLEGLEEPDRYVLMGNHHDAWTYGGIDPSSATANMLELSRVFGKLYSDGWRPRRTLVFCSWDAEEPGLIGSTEYAEQFSATLADRAVVYLNVDMVMGGNYSFAATGLPHLNDIIFNAARAVPNPDCDEFEAGRKFLYDTWVTRFPDGDPDDPKPIVGPLGTGSDYRAFVYNLGIPALDLCFTQDPNSTELPLYHMAYETYELATKLMDVGLSFHEASARMWGLLAYYFSSGYVLPINVVKLSKFVLSSVTEFRTTWREKLLHLNVTMDTIETAAEIFDSATQDFWKRLQNANLENELILRRYNDAMMLMDKALLASHGLPRRPNLNYVLVGPDPTNEYVWETFPGLKDYFRDETQLGFDATRRGFTEHAAAIAFHLNLAANALTFAIW